MLEVEGGTREWCLQILRHETGHAIENAYDLRRAAPPPEPLRPTSHPYPEYYSPKPYSKSFVIHLDGWYAQSHPDEDFAETFAVWLTPGSDWARALRGLAAPCASSSTSTSSCGQLAGKAAPGARPDAAPSTRCRASRTPCASTTSASARHYGVDQPDAYDRDLLRDLLRTRPSDGATRGRRFLSRIRRTCAAGCSAGPASTSTLIDQVLGDMIERCRELELRLRGSGGRRAAASSLVLLTAQTMNRLHSGRHRLAL